MTGNKPILVVGASVAGVKTVEALRSNNYDGPLEIVSPETVPPYDKPPLSKEFLSGEQTREDIALLEGHDWGSLDVRAYVGQAAVSLDVEARSVTLDDGSRLAFSRLIIATGARPRELSPVDRHLVHVIRSIADVDMLRKRLKEGASLVVIGSGFLGAEVAATACSLGVETMIVEASSAPFSRGVGGPVSQRIEQMHRAHGVTIFAGAPVEAIESDGRDLANVRLADGRSLQAAAVAVCVGVVPNTEWLEGSGLQLNDGVVTDEFCQVNGVKDIWAIGDVSRWFDLRAGIHRRVEHWTSALEQAELVARNILNPDYKQPYDAAPYYWSDQFDTRIQGVGHIGSEDQVQLYADNGAGQPQGLAVYLTPQGQFSAAVCINVPRIVPFFRKAWRDHATAEEITQIIGRRLQMMNRVDAQEFARKEF